MTDELSTSELSARALLAQLRSAAGDEAFEQFLELFSPAILHVARQYAYDRDQRDTSY